MAVIRYLIILLLLASCTHSKCRRKKEDASLPKPQINFETANNNVITTPMSSRVMVYKYDGSLQCNLGKPVSLNVMAKELGNIKIYNSENKLDGIMHIQVCGSPTGRVNVYEIAKEDLEKAKSLGFHLWEFN